nr:MAG TPA: hypothetical protein [Caudoviricetes sp.]
MSDTLPILLVSSREDHKIRSLSPLNRSGFYFIQRIFQ